MTRVLAAAPFGVTAFIAALVLAALAARAGVLPDDAVKLWASATAAGGGDVSVGRMIAAYPTLPYLASAMLAAIAPERAPATVLLSAALLGALAAGWFLAFRRAQLPVGIAATAALLIALHPALLRAGIAGPADLLLTMFLFMLAGALYDLRRRTATPEVMTVGLALLGLTFSHPMGAAIAFAALPFLVLAVRPTLVASSALNVVVALIFPTVFAIGAFTYVSWVFPGSGWSFLATPAESLSAWSASVVPVLGDGQVPLAIEAGCITLVALLIGAPVSFVATARVRRRRPLLVPGLVLVAIVVTASMITVATGAFGAPATLAVAAPVFAAVAVTRLPGAREKASLTVTLLAAGWICGAASLAMLDPASLRTVAIVLDGRAADSVRVDTLAAGGAMAERDGVLIDTDNAPAIVLGRGRARGLLAPASEGFGLALLFARLDAPFVAVPDPQSPLGRGDRLNKTFPTLYRQGAPGYRLVYQNNTWRLFARNTIYAVYRN